MSTSIAGVIFDMDGVLLDSQPLHYQADVAFLRALGFAATYEDAAPYGGMSSPDRMARYKARFGITQSAAALAAQHATVMMDLFQRTPLTPTDGVVSLLAHLRETGRGMAVASSSSRALIDLILDKLGITAYFHAVVAGEDVTVGKPAPDIFLSAAKALGHPPTACVVVEDSVYGIQSACAAGMRCVAYRNPNTFGQDFSLATYVIDHFSDALVIFQ